MSEGPNQIEELWNHVPPRWQEGICEVLRFLNAEEPSQRIGSFFRSPGTSSVTTGKPRAGLGRNSRLETPANDERQKHLLRHIHGFSYVITGSVSVVFGRQGYKTVRPGDLLIVSGDQESVEIGERSPDLREMSLHVDGLTGQRLCDAGLWDLETGIVPLGRRLSLVNAYVSLQQDLEDHAVSTAGLLRKFTAMVDEIYTLGSMGSPAEEFRSQACNRLAAKAMDDGAIPDTARALGFSPRQFRRRFRAVTGEAPREFLLRVRMAHAEHLLSTCSVKETAARLGYSDPFVFSRQYKRMFGISPSQSRGMGRALLR